MYNRLESRFTLLLCNAHHLKAVPGRKTDVKDSEWIADLLRHGLLRGSFVPEREQRELRELTRYRTTLIQERTAALNRLQKTLEGANVKLTSVATDVLGKSGRAMVEAMIAGQTDAAVLADLAVGRLREKLPQLERALAGSLGAHQRFLLAQQVAHIDFLETQIAQVSAEVDTRLHPFETVLARLDTLPGVGQRTAETLIAEIGTDLSRFPSARHLASWAGLCPGNRESAGKRLSGKTRKGNAYLRAVLIEAAHAAARTKNTYLAAKYHRLAQRLGKKKAAVAIAHLLLRLLYALLTQNTLYHELGTDYLEQRDREALQRRLVRRLEKTGVRVTLTSVDPAA